MFVFGGWKVCTIDPSYARLPSPLTNTQPPHLCPNSKPDLSRAGHRNSYLSAALVSCSLVQGDKFLDDLYVLSGFGADGAGEYRWSSPKTHGERASARAYHTSTAVDSKMLVRHMRVQH
jgi:hypothetical protein